MFYTVKETDENIKRKIVTKSLQTIITGNHSKYEEHELQTTLRT